MPKTERWGVKMEGVVIGTLLERTPGLSAKGLTDGPSRKPK